MKRRSACLLSPPPGGAQITVGFCLPPHGRKVRSRGAVRTIRVPYQRCYAVFPPRTRPEANAVRMRAVTGHAILAPCTGSLPRSSRHSTVCADAALAHSRQRLELTERAVGARLAEGRFLCHVASRAGNAQASTVRGLPCLGRVGPRGRLEARTPRRPGAVDVGAGQARRWFDAGGAVGGRVESKHLAVAAHRTRGCSVGTGDTLAIGAGHALAPRGAATRGGLRSTAR